MMIEIDTGMYSTGMKTPSYSLALKLVLNHQEDLCVFFLL